MPIKGCTGRVSLAKRKMRPSDLYQEPEPDPVKKRYHADEFSLHSFVIKHRVRQDLWGVRWCPEWIKVKGFNCKKQAEQCLAALQEEADLIGSEFEYKIFER